MNINILIKNLILFFLSHLSKASILTTPPQSALIVAFENTYDLSLLANTLSDQGIDSTLIIPSSTTEVYEHLIEVEVLPLELPAENPLDLNSRALSACKALITDGKISRRVQELQPTFTIFPAIRHDACLIPWAKSIRSIPVIWTLGMSEEIYVFLQTGSALPINSDGFVITLLSSLKEKLFLLTTRNNYVEPALAIVSSHFNNIDPDYKNLYRDVDLILWGGDTVLRSNFAPLTQLLVEIGCHHCRGVQSLPQQLHQELIKFKTGIVASTLDANYLDLMKEIARELKQGGQDQAIVWKQKNLIVEEKSTNLFIYGEVDRQDLIGYPRTRVLLSHCTETELLESAHHGTPVICLPRNFEELENAERVSELGISYSIRSDFSTEKVLTAINEVYSNGEYRERARRVSSALRDRPLPAMDRVIFWLRYIARVKTEGENLLLPPKNINTYNDIWQFLWGMFTGTIFSISATIFFFIARSSHSKERQQKMKIKYKR